MLLGFGVYFYTIKIPTLGERLWARSDSRRCPEGLCQEGASYELEVKLWRSLPGEDKDWFKYSGGRAAQVVAVANGQEEDDTVLHKLYVWL